MGFGSFLRQLGCQGYRDVEALYEKLGFSVFMGDQSQNWLIMKNGAHAIRLFQGMFEKNILSFNPGWSSDAQKLDTFTDVRELQRRLKVGSRTDVLRVAIQQSGG